MTIHPTFIRLTELSSISTEVKTALASRFIKQIFSPNQILLGEGQKPSSLYFIEAGLLRSYYQLRSEEITREFITEQEFLIPANFFSRGFSNDYLVTMERSVVHSISHEDVMQVLYDYPELNQGLRELLEYQYERCQRRDQFLRITSAIERYRLFKSQYPGVLNQATLPILSSYLNISRKHLSRIKNQEARRK